MSNALVGVRCARAKLQSSHATSDRLLKIAGEEIPLMSFATAADRTGGDFPETAIVKDIDLRTRVYDCYQSAHISSSGEDQFERDGRIAGVERLFMNERDGSAKIRLEVAFVPFLRNDPSASSRAVCGFRWMRWRR